MTANKQATIRSSTDGGVVGNHPDPNPFEFFVAPATSDESNAARLRLIPIACFRIDDVRFKFDSSFVLPDVQADMSSFSDLRKQDPRVMGAPISIFGHADPTFQGNFEPGSSTAQSGDDYNKTLSGRRAIAIYAMLIRDPSFWNTLFSNHLGGDIWGEDSIRIILDFLDQQGQSLSGSSASSSQSTSDSAKNARVRDIANDSGQRQQLFLQYMSLLCGDLKLDKSSDFLARGAGPNQKGDVQGCSRFNPLLLFSQEKEAEFKTADQNKDQGALATRNLDNAQNRRVMILIFRLGSQVLPAKWPCPTFKEGSSACKKRFFSDGDTRRSTHTPGSDRKFDLTQDTFACRFYQRLSGDSPCNTQGDILIIWLLDDDGQRLPVGTPYRLTLGSQIRTGSLRQKGLIIEGALQLTDQATIEWGKIQPKKPISNSDDRFLRTRVLLDEPDHPFLSDTTGIPDPPQGLFPFRADMNLNTDHSIVDDLHVVQIRLKNMGYPKLIQATDDLDIFQDDYEFLDQKLEQLKTSLRDIHRDGTEMPLDQPSTPAPTPVPLDSDGFPASQCGE